MPLIQAIILAVVQGLTEFLPVSSTAHLVLFPWLLHWPDPGEAFDVALHAGTLVAVLLYFFKDWLTLTLCGLGMSYPKAAPPEEVAQHRPSVLVHGHRHDSRRHPRQTLRQTDRRAPALAGHHRRIDGGHRPGHVVGRLPSETATAKNRPIRHGRRHRHRNGTSSGALAGRLALRHHHHRGLIPQFHPRSGHPIFLPAFGSADCRRRCLQNARP